jgi:prepilin-type N-terminal cleavage/methylation domain-containing protein
MIATNFLRRRRAPTRQLWRTRARSGHLAAIRAARPPRLAAEDGFTLIEVLVATIVLSIGIVGTLGMINTTTKTSALTHDREGAVSLARQIVEDAHTIPFDQIAPGTAVEKLQALPGLENATPGPTWTIVRGASNTQQGATYTVTVHACYIDEPRDGLAKTSELTSEEAAMFCEGHKGNEEWKSGAVDPTPIDFKRVTVNVSWHETGRTPSVQQVSVFGAAGEPTSLSLSELQLVPPPQPYGITLVTQPTITENASELTFSVCAPKSSTAVLWSLEGVLQSPSAKEQSTTCKSGEGLIWTFKWKIEGLSDGTYQVSAQATTTKGVLGPPVTIPVTLIRKRPAPPKGVKGDFNEVYMVGGAHMRAIELEWAANSERDVIGYRVYSPSGLVCPPSSSELSLSLSCIEVPAKFTPESGLTYKVVALYRNEKNEVAEGEQAAFLLTYPVPAAPNPPTELEAKETEGTVRLTWKPPTEGEEVAFYRIYRDSKDYTSRYDTASGNNPTYTDTETTGIRKYWVTAVSKTLTESEFSNEASG